MIIRNCLKLLNDLGHLEEQIKLIESELKSQDREVELEEILVSIYRDYLQKNLQ